MRYAVICLITMKLALFAVPDTLEPLTVKPDEALSTTPEESISTTQLSGETLALLHVENLQELSSRVPNMKVSSFGSRSESFIAMRGFSNYGALAPSIGIYIDDIPIASIYGYRSYSMYDLEEVNIYRGIEAGNFGRNAPMGAIAITTAQPTEHPLVEVSAGAGSYNRRAFSLKASGPTLDGKASYLVSLHKSRRDGYTHNSYLDDDIDSEDGLGMRLKLHYKPSSGIAFSLTHHANQLSDGIATYDTDPATPFEMAYNHQGHVTQRSNATALKFVFSKGSSQLTSITSHTDQTVDKEADGDLSTADILVIDNHRKIKEFTQELRLSAQQGMHLFTAGAFYGDKYLSSYLENQHFMSDSGVDGFRSWDADEPAKNAALFGSIDTTVAANWHLDIGLRYQYTGKTFVRDFTQSFSPEIPALGLVNLTADTVTEHRSYEALLPKVKLSYQPTKGHAYFLSYYHGMKAGGFNVTKSNLLSDDFAKEKSRSCELGMQFAGMSDTLLNVSLFYTQVKNLQVVGYQDDLSAYTINAQQAMTYGFEGDITYYPFDTFELFGAIGLTRGEYTTFTHNGDDYSGNQLINVPAYTLSLGFGYAVDAHLSTGADLQEAGETYFDMENRYRQGRYRIVNAHIDYRYQRFQLSVYGKNLFDERYYNYIIYSPNIVAYNFAAPVEYGFNASLSF